MSEDAMIRPAPYGGPVDIQFRPGVTLTVSRNLAQADESMTVWGYRYSHNGKAVTVTATSLDDAQRNIADLWNNLGIGAVLLWREVTVSVSEWK